MTLAQDALTLVLGLIALMMYMLLIGRWTRGRESDTAALKEKQEDQARVIELIRGRWHDHEGRLLAMPEQVRERITSQCITRAECALITGECFADRNRLQREIDALRLVERESSNHPREA